MTNLNNKIVEKISKIIFSDGSSAESRASTIIVKNNNVGFSLNIESIDLKEAEIVRSKIIDSLKEIEDIGKVTIILTKSKMETKEKAKIYIEEADKVIVIAAGKGGVGKSTISALLAHKLAKEGAKVGIIDADIYGPSIPSIFGLVQEKPLLDGNKMIPIEKYGIKINSVGFLVKPEEAVSMRGPMTSKTLYQLLSLTKWGKLDYLIIDTPPGTGDIHISLLQNYMIDSAIIVTTPQKISEIDVVRTINLYQKFGIPITGIIENMSYFIDPATGKSINIFEGSSGSKISEKYNIPLLARLMMNPDLSRACDNGESLAWFSEMFEGVIV